MIQICYNFVFLSYLTTQYFIIFIFQILLETQHAKDQLAMIEERHSELLKIEKLLEEVHNQFLQMAVLVEQQVIKKKMLQLQTY